ncbi:MAG TPA: hypothetical protein VHN11_15710, partial [Xanthobacteraceae bacterium]|nr:hypothetical protein [Xanthobacteraceae bacterium]
YVLSFSEALHAELAPRGIRVTALCPGPVATEFQARAGVSLAAFPKILVRGADRVAREGYEGFMQGRPLIVPGGANKIATWLPRLLPRKLVLAIVRIGNNGRSASPPVRWQRRRSDPS